VIPCIDTPQENGYTKEEMKMVWELSKIFNTDSMKVSCTAVRVPTERAHCVSASIEFDRPITSNSAKSILSGAPGVVVKDDMANKVYPLPETASGRFDVEVGRIRQSLVFEQYGIDMFVCGDQLLRGAALNAVRIALLLNRK
jgi:aspartate-semialdehyde dehydrogenase